MGVFLEHTLYIHKLSPVLLIEILYI